MPESTQSVPASAQSSRHRSEISLLLGWIAGLVLVLVCGWCLEGLAFYLSRDSKVSPEIGFSIGAVFSLVMFLVLEWKHGLSRLMGLRYDPNAPGWLSAILFWLFGIAVLLFRSSQAPAAELSPATEPGSRTERKAQATQQTDSFREIVETVVFVVVLVLMLKSFAAEAFVIPTGSMAETLLGYQKEVTCPKCGYVFPVNTSGEEERKERVEGCICPNCRYVLNRNEMPNDSNSGDRVLVAKFMYDLLNGHPDRLDVVVFKYPEKPLKDYSPYNYIKRCIGLPGETIGIYCGKLYCLEPGESFHYDDGNVSPLELWQKEHMHVDEPPEEQTWLKNRQHFKIIRKAPRHIDALKRLVYDNDHPASDLTKWPRWAGDGNKWAESAPNEFSHAPSPSDEVDWLRYHHRLRPGGLKSELITDFMGYNSYITTFADDHPDKDIMHRFPQNWVGDLLLECQATIDQPQGTFVLELSKSVDRFQARFDVATGECTLQRVTGTNVTVLDKKPTGLRKGSQHVRFANIDDRLIVWVGRNLPFGDGVPYEPAKENNAATENDLEPASIGVQGGGVAVHKIKLWRDTYYTIDPRRGSDAPSVDFGDPGTWSALADRQAKTIYVQPGHYLCLGDNSPQSSDGREWGLVPNRLLLGRALLVYWPFGRAGRIE